MDICVCVCDGKSRFVYSYFPLNDCVREVELTWSGVEVERTHGQ